MQQLLIMLSSKLSIILPRVLRIAGRLIAIIYSQIGESLPDVREEWRGHGHAAYECVCRAHAQAVALKPRPPSRVRTAAYAGIHAEAAR